MIEAEVRTLKAADSDQQHNNGNGLCLHNHKSGLKAGIIRRMRFGITQMITNSLPRYNTQTGPV